MLPEQFEQHEMILDKTHDSEAEEWYCPVCNRRYLIQWLPEFKQIVLETGNEFALHNGSKGGLKIQASQAMQENEPTPDTDPGLRQWEDWLNRVDFESWWREELH